MTLGKYTIRPVFNSVMLFGGAEDCDCARDKRGINT